MHFMKFDHFIKGDELRLYYNLISHYHNRPEPDYSKYDYLVFRKL